MREVTISEALSRRFPERLYLLISVDKDGKANIMTIGWCVLTSFDPLMVAISVCKERYSHSLISENGEFTLAFPTASMKEKVLYCGSYSGRDVDKLTESGLITLPAKKVKTPLIDKCNVNLECKVIDKLDTGSNTMFVGEILAAHISEQPQKGLFNLGADRYGGI